MFIFLRARISGILSVLLIQGALCLAVFLFEWEAVNGPKVKIEFFNCLLTCLQLSSERFFHHFAFSEVGDSDEVDSSESTFAKFLQDLKIMNFYRSVFLFSPSLKAKTYYKEKAELTSAISPKNHPRLPQV